jgi:putative ABC transport system substrate-binding protein
MTETSRTACPWFRSDNRKSAIQNPKWLGLPVIVFLLVVAGAVVQAQQPKKIPRIGYLTSSGRSSFEAFATALRQLGYVEGKSVIFEFRTTENTAKLQPELAAELTQLRVDVIVAVGAGAIRAAKNATSTIPIVMSEVNDPIALGFVASLAHPGGNITGMSNLAPELSGKRLELLKEVVPRASRIAVLSYRGEAMRSSIKETEVAARSLRLQVQLLEVKVPDEIAFAFDAAKKQRADALVQIQAFFNSHQPRIIELAVKNQLPAMYNSRIDVEAGGLMSYGYDALERNQRVASLVDRIVKGANPADLPIEQPTKFEFVVNLKAAKQIGVTIAPNVLVRADKVIK